MVHCCEGSFLTLRVRKSCRPPTPALAELGKEREKEGVDSSYVRARVRSSKDLGRVL
jgi:hypothetical protein